MIQLSDKAEEGGTYAITGISFKDEAGADVLPNLDPTWSLCKEDGTVIDNGTLQAGLSMDLVLSGDQLAVSSDELTTFNTVLGKKVYYVNRSVFVRGVIDSSLGNDLPVTQEFIFLIDNITCLT